MEKVFVFVLLGFLISGFTLSRFLRNHSRSIAISKRLNRWIIVVALPAVVVQKIHSLPDFSWNNPAIFLPVSQPWIHFLLNALVISAIAWKLKWNRGVFGSLLLTVGLGNTSFVGLPLLKALLGPGSLGTGIIMDQLGTFLILALVGVPLGRAISSYGGSFRWSFKELSRVCLYPPFIALIAALVLRWVTLPEWTYTLLGWIGATLPPAALISVGLSIQWRALRKKQVRYPLAIGLILKLVLFPIFHWFLYSNWAAHFSDLDPLVLKAILLESSMASMIMAGIVAAESGLEPELSQLMVGVSIPLSLLTVPLWAVLLGFI
ncbi:MAG: AEC family transporter [Bdellovibrionales bacterium]|nr:AEC family transporter [Bdellovibrionales bacterium]